MSASKYVGRVGSLAVTFGVGAAVLSSVAVASAETGSRDGSEAPPSSTASSQSASQSASPSASSTSARQAGPRRAVRPAAEEQTDPAAAPSITTPRAIQPRAAAAAKPRSAASRAADVVSANLDAEPSAAPKPIAVPNAVSDAEAGINGAGVNIDAPLRRSSATIANRADQPVVRTAVPAVGAASAVATDMSTFGTLTAPAPAGAVTSVFDPNALAPRMSLRVVGITFVSTTVGVVSALIQQMAMAVHLGPSRSAFNQTVDLKGYSLVPNSTELVTSFYGPWTYGPGGLNIVQGRQGYDVVDPATEQSVGSFNALVSTGHPLGLGDYVELVVTSAEGNVGVDAGQVPPVGSVIANMKLFGGFGWKYSAMPSESANIISVSLTTPLGDIPIPFFFNKFDAAQGIADHTVDNRPIELGNGYSIAPSDPDGETFTGTSGFLPLFQTIQTTQRFDLRDSSGATVGSFDAVATTTWDALGAYTEAVLVTKSYGDNIGTGVGQVPPPGTVYNVGYAGSDEDWALSTSMPSPSGNLVSMIEATPDGVRNVLTFPVNRLDAAAPPPVKRLPFAGGSGILPTSELVPFGVNGLPPRDVQIQGYQQFAVYDQAGVQQGSFDAIVTRQWDWVGIYSEAIMVTKVTDGTAGIAAGEVPPVGSVINYVNFGNSGFGSSYWSLPSPSGTKISYKIVTPIIDIPTWSTYNASAGLDTVTFVNPLHAEPLRVI